MAELLTNFGRTTLDGSVTDVQTTLTVIDGSVFPATGNFRVNCEDELMLCTARATNVLTVTRAIEGTLADAHGTGKYVSQVATAGGVTEMINERTVATSLYLFENHR